VAGRGDVMEPRSFRSLFVLARRGESRKRNLLPPGSLDHLVGACEKSRGEVNTDRLRRHIIHRQLKLGWLLDRQVGRVGTEGRRVGVILDNRRLGRVSFTPVDSVRSKMRGD
jgi:hypothetical protein